jgi:hypothetical protein
MERRTSLLRRLVAGAALLAAIGLTGCVSVGVPVTGLPGQGHTQAFDQSETAVNVSNFGAKSVITVTANDGTDTGSTILYTSSTRKTLKGASLLGWSYSQDSGATWTFGGKLSPPAGWSVLWGDPAITRSHLDQRYVFLSNLAVPDSKFPPAGIDGPLNSYLGGACIARSANGGVSFGNYQCFGFESHFYDGGSMAAGSDGSIYAGYVDVNDDQIDVWRSPGIDGTFTRMPRPFPGIAIYSHPRLRFDLASGTLYVAAQRSDGYLFVTRFLAGSWQSPVAASALPVALYPSITLSDRELRTGPQFSFDIGAESLDGDDNPGHDPVRFLYTTFDGKGKRYYVRGSFCERDLSGCKDAPEWGTTPGNLSLTGDQFNPVLRAFPGFIGLPPIWKATYLSRQDDPAGNTVILEQGNLVRLPNGFRILLPFKLVDSHLVCPDNRGYWGDYDDMQLSGFNGTAAVFLRALSDSSQGCTERWEYTSHHVHVSAVKVE